jgi:VWFA-related protein
VNSFSQTKTPRAALVSVFLILGFCINAFPQSQQREKPRLKDFGSSLKKLKWDPQKNETVITQQASRDDVDVITIETSLVTSDVLVTDKQGRPVRDLKATDFVVSEDGVPQQIGHFVLGDNVNLSRSIVLIIDYSRSQFPYIADSIEAAGVLVDQLGPKDRMAIVTDDVDLLVDFTNDKRELKRGLESLLERNRGAKSFLGVGGKRPRFGRSAQFSALMATLNEAFDEEDQNPVIVFQTDGDELEFLRNSVIVHEVPSGLPPEILREVQEEVEQKRRLQRSLMTEFSLDDVYRAAERSRATIYSIIPRTRLLDLTQDEQIKRLAAEDSRSVATWSEASSEKMRNSFKVLEEQRRKRLTPEILQARIDQELKIQRSLVDLAKMSGGWAEFLETKSQTTSIYNRILADLNLRYIIGYYPSNKTHDGKKRQIAIEVKGHPEYIISSRKSYYAPGR